MNQLTLKLGKATKRVTLQKSNDPQDLARILESTFKTRERIVGVTDQYGKFYHLNFVNDNLGFLRPHTLSLVTVKDNEENMSFASDNGEQEETKKENIHDQELFHQAHGFLGTVHDLDLFEELLLEDKKLVLVICSSEQKSQMQLPYNFYVHESPKSTVIIYYDRRKIGELYIDNWKKLEQRIDSIVKSFQEQDQPNQWPPRQRQTEEVSQKNEQNDNQLPTTQIKNTFLENLVKLRQEETISELQFYKLKSKLLENPQDFMRKYQMGTRQGFRKRKSIDDLRDEIVKSKQEKSRYQTIISEFRNNQIPSREHRNFKNQIPIIVRKYNNVIQKISTSYPLNLQQEQAINLTMELQLKGLISETDSRDYKSLILQEDPQVFCLFAQYFQDLIDQIQLSRRLKNKKRTDRKTQEDKNKSEEVVRMIIKYAKRNSFELLRNLAVEGNSYIMKCFERFEKDKNAGVLTSTLEKISNYYRAKNRLQDRLEFEELDVL